MMLHAAITCYVRGRGTYGSKAKLAHMTSHMICNEAAPFTYVDEDNC